MTRGGAILSGAWESVSSLSVRHLMKRCPQCNRIEADDVLAFCRADGAALVSDSGAIAGDANTAKFGSVPASSEIETSVLPHRIEAFVKRPTAPTTVLPVPPTQDTARELTKPRRRGVVMASAALVLVAIVVAGYFYFSRKSSPNIRSIAVMPFVNEGGNADLDYLSDGMTETLIGSLSKIANLSVKARSAVFRYKGTEVSVKQIGDELGVQAVLLGRLVAREGNIRLNLELVNARTLDVLWSEQYDRKQAELINLQNEIARDVSSKLSLKLSGESELALNKKYTDDAEAYRLYLQGRFYLNKRVGREFEKAAGFLRQSIARDPDFALGYVGLAEFVSQSDRPKAKEYILRALAIDNQLSDAHAALGFQLVLDRDWAAAERELARAIELDPNNARAYQWNGSRLMMIGRYDECLSAYDRAIVVEPTLADLRNNRGACLVAAGRVDEGIAEVKKAMEVDPEYAWLYSHVSFLYRMKGDHAASVEARARSAELVDRPELAARLRDTFRAKGWTAYLRELLEQTRDLFPSRTRRASILAELGEHEEAIASLNLAAEEGDWWLFSIKYDPAFDPLRDDPRFHALLKIFDPPPQ